MDHWKSNNYELRITILLIGNPISLSFQKDNNNMNTSVIKTIIGKERERGRERKKKKEIGEEKKIASTFERSKRNSSWCFCEILSVERDARAIIFGNEGEISPPPQMKSLR